MRGVSRRYGAWRINRGPARPRRARPYAKLIVAAFCLFAGTAEAQLNCRVSVNPFAFGNYAPGNPAPHDVTGNIDVSCRGAAGSFIATLSTGSSGIFAQRRMLSGAAFMFYNFFIDAARTIVWGDGTGGTMTVNGVKPNPGRQDYSLAVYGRIPPTQSVSPGLYTDDIVVTIVF